MNKKVTAYHSIKAKSPVQAFHYSQTHDSSHRYLAYRDIPTILRKHSVTGTALDYGTGTGYSANFLHELGFDVTAVDISQEMLLQAQLKYSNLSFHQVEHGETHFKPSSFDLVFSSFVLFEIENAKKIIEYLKEAKRLIKQNGLFLAVTGSKDLHSPTKKWLNFDANFAQNKKLTSGAPVKLLLKEYNIEFTDYYWTESNYRDFLDKAGFKFIETYYPLGKTEEPYHWHDEIATSPFLILAAR